MDMHTRDLPTNSAERKDLPIATGVLDYFPDALADVARLSKIGNDKHNPGQPLHWSRGKSTDHADCILRHMIERGKVDTDGVLHDTKVAWRALAQLQLAIERLRSEGKNYGSACNEPTAPKAGFTYWYLATPYTKYPAGHEAASLMACRLAGDLLRRGVPVFSPIAHSHPIAMAGLEDVKTNHNFWVDADRPMLDAASGLIVVLAEGWEESRGMAHEIEEFRRLGKPIVWWDPACTIPSELV